MDDSPLAKRAREIAQIAVSEPHARAVFCLVCHREVRPGWHMHVTTRGWETCGYCSEGCALRYVRSVDADLPLAPPPDGQRDASR